MTPPEWIRNDRNPEYRPQCVNGCGSRRTQTGGTTMQPEIIATHALELLASRDAKGFGPA
jgi:hypothetical protein